jgi:hypothetical protein
MNAVGCSKFGAIDLYGEVDIENKVAVLELKYPCKIKLIYTTDLSGRSTTFSGGLRLLGRQISSIVVPMVSSVSRYA